MTVDTIVNIGAGPELEDAWLNAHALGNVWDQAGVCVLLGTPHDDFLRSPQYIPEDAEVWTFETDGWLCWRVLSRVPQVFTEALPFTYSATRVRPAQAEPVDLGELQSRVIAALTQRYRAA